MVSPDIRSNGRASIPLIPLTCRYRCSTGKEAARAADPRSTDRSKSAAGSQHPNDWAQILAEDTFRRIATGKRHLHASDASTAYRVERTSLGERLGAWKS